jgi:hypothetical protein
VQEIELVHQYDKLVFPEVLFNRPISGLGRLHVLLLAGEISQLSIFSQVFTALRALSLNPDCVAIENELTNSFLPVGSVKIHVDKKSHQILETAQLIESSERSNLVIISPGSNLTSSSHMLYEKIMSQTQAPVILTDEAVGIYANLPRQARSRANVMLTLSLQGLKALEKSLDLHVEDRPGRGIYNLLHHMGAVQGVVKADIVCRHEGVVLVQSQASSKRCGVIHLEASNAEAYQGILIGLIAGLMTEPAPVLRGGLEKVMTAGYLFNMITRASKELTDPVRATALIKHTIADALG